jgi:AcrR family transcriptional regulator
VFILEAAFQVFSRQGYHAAKIEDIAKEAAIGKGTVYEYFESKSQLFHHMIEHIIEKYNEGLRSTLGQNCTIRESLIGFAAYQAQVLSQNMSMAYALSTDTTVTQEIRTMLIRQNSHSTDLLREAIHAAKGRGELRADLDLEAATMAVFGTVNQYFIQKLCLNKMVLSSHEPELVIDTLLKGMTQ